MKENQAVEFLPIDSVAPYPRNPRTHPQANVAKLVASIKEFGWTTPILVDEEGAVLAGHGRLLAARALLMPKVPCLRIPGLSSAQKRAYRLADNRLTLDSDWDLEMLALELQELGEFDLALTGFGQEELDEILRLADPQSGEDDIPEVQETAVSQLGDIWQLGVHQLLCGKCEDSFNLQFDLIITSPPYNQMIDQWEPSGM